MCAVINDLRGNVLVADEYTEAWSLSGTSDFGTDTVFASSQVLNFLL
jgi:hypothetical protein